MSEEKQSLRERLEKNRRFIGAGRLRGQKQKRRPKKSAANHRRYRGKVLTLPLDPEIQLETRSAEHIDVVRRG